MNLRSRLELGKVSVAYKNTATSVFYDAILSLEILDFNKNSVATTKFLNYGEEEIARSQVLRVFLLVLYSLSLSLFKFLHSVFF